MSYLVHEPNIKLHINSKNIKNININTYNLSKKLILVMKFYYGIGLAAVQIGILKKIVSINYLIYKKRKSITLINTKIIKNSKEYIKIEEGCLSYKNNYNINVYRHHYVKIYYLDLQNKKQYLNIKKKNIIFVYST